MHERFRKPSTEVETTYALEVLALARAAVAELNASGEKVVQFKFGKREGTLWLSADRRLVIGSEQVDVDGKTYYIGIFKADKK